MISYFNFPVVKNRVAINGVFLSIIISLLTLLVSQQWCILGCTETKGWPIGYYFNSNYSDLKLGIILFILNTIVWFIAVALLTLIIRLIKISRK